MHLITVQVKSISMHISGNEVITFALHGNILQHIYVHTCSTLSAQHATQTYIINELHKISVQ